MNENEHINLHLRSPRTSDKQLDYQTYLAVVEALRHSGGNGLFSGPNGPDNAPNPFPGGRMRMAKITGRVRVAGESGKIPDDTEVYAYTGIEVRWDSSSLSYVDTDSGYLWDGTANNYLRLLGQPGFANKNYEEGPLLTDAVVPIIEISENASYASSSDEVDSFQLNSKVFYILWHGEDPVVHPFKATLGDTKKKIVVGYMRDFVVNAGDGTDTASSSHTGVDLITIMGSTTPTVIELATADELEVVGLQGTDSIIYYEIDTSSEAPTATLKESEEAEWPPAEPSDQSNILLIPICYVRITGPELPTPADPEISTIGQLQFSHVNFDGAGGGGVAVRRSVQLVAAIVQFLNDIKINLLGTNKQLGYVYGGQDVAKNLARQYFPNWDEGASTFSYLNPQAIQGSGGPEERNKGELRMKATNNHTTEVYHSRFEEDARITSETTDTIWVRTADPGGGLHFPFRRVKNGHMYPLGSATGDPYEPTRVTNLAFDSVGAIAASGTLFDDSIAQEVRTVDDLGANIATENSPVNKFSYSALNSAGDTIEINAVGSHSTAAAIEKLITTYAVPKSGNNENILFNIARFGFNTQITLSARYINTPFTSASLNFDGENEMSSSIAFSADPETAVVFTVTLNLLKAGLAYGRLDSLGEYRVIFTFTYKSDVSAVIINGGGNTVTVNDPDFAAGVVVTPNLTPTIPANRTSDKMVCTPVLEWFNNANAQPNMFGETNFILETVEADITGSTTFTHSVAAGSITTPTPIVSSVNTGGVLDVPIDIEYEILDAAAATTDFSTGNVETFIQLYALSDLNTPLDISIAIPDGAGGAFDDEFLEDIINPTNSNNTDGLVFQIVKFLSESDITQGSDYKIVIATAGIPAVAAYIFNMTEIGIMFWSDGFGSTSQDNPFSLSDDFTGIGTNSKEVSDENWLNRWEHTGGGGALLSDWTITGGVLTVSFTQGTSNTIFTDRVGLWGQYKISLENYVRTQTTEFSLNIAGNFHQMIIYHVEDRLNLQYSGSGYGNVANGVGSGASMSLLRNGAPLQQCARNGSPYAQTSNQGGNVDQTSLSVTGPADGGGVSCSKYSIMHEPHTGLPLIDYEVPWPKRWKSVRSGGRDYIVPGSNEVTLEVNTSAGVCEAFIDANFTVGDPNMEIGYREDGGGGLELFIGFGVSIDLPIIFSEARANMDEVIMRRDAWTYSDFGGSLSLPDQVSVTQAIFDSRWNTTNITNPPSSVTMPALPTGLLVSVDSPGVQIEGARYTSDVRTDAGSQLNCFGNCPFVIKGLFTVSGVSDPDPKGPNCDVRISINVDEYICGWSTEHNGTYFSVNGTPTVLETYETGGTFKFTISLTGTTVSFFIDYGAGDVLEGTTVITNNQQITLPGVRMANDAGGAGTNASANFQLLDYFFSQTQATEYTEPYILFEETAAATLILARKIFTVAGTAQELHLYSVQIALAVSGSHARLDNDFKSASGFIGNSTWKITGTFGDNNFGGGVARWVKCTDSQLEAPTGVPYSTA